MLKMFKSKAIIMLTGVVCGCIVLCIIEFLSGSDAWVAWGYTTAIGIGALIFVLAKRSEKKKKRGEK